MLSLLLAYTSFRTNSQIGSGCEGYDAHVTQLPGYVSPIQYIKDVFGSIFIGIWSLALIDNTSRWFR